MCEAISLDLNSGTATSGSQLPQDQIVDYALTADDDTLTFNFAPSEDGNTHYLVCGISLSLNKRVTDIRPTVRIYPPRKMLS